MYQAVITYFDCYYGEPRQSPRSVIGVFRPNDIFYFGGIRVQLALNISGKLLFVHSLPTSGTMCREPVILWGRPHRNNGTNDSNMCAPGAKANRNCKYLQLNMKIELCQSFHED